MIGYTSRTAVRTVTVGEQSTRVLEAVLDLVVSVPSQPDATVVAVVDQQRTCLVLWMVGRGDTPNVTTVTENHERERGDEGVLDHVEPALEGTRHRLHEILKPGREFQVQRTGRQRRLIWVE